MSVKPLAEASVLVTAEMSGLNRAVAGLATSLVTRLGNIGRAAGNALSAGISLGATAGLTALAATFAGGGLLAGITTGLASDAQETASKLEYVFGYSSQKVKKSLDEFGKAAGRSRNDLRMMAADVGALLKPLGFTNAEVGRMSVQVTTLASDLASFFNSTDEEAIAALKSGLVGESEPLKKYGIILSEVRIKQEALNLGLVKGKEDLTAVAKSQAILSLIMKDSAAAISDATRTSGAYANTLRFMQGAFKDLGTSIGKLFIPAATAIARSLGNVAAYLEPATSEFEEWGRVIGEITSNVLGHIGRLAQGFQEFFSGRLNSLITAASGGIITSFSGLVTESLSLLATLTHDFEATWRLAKTGAALAFTQIGLSIAQTLNTAKAVALGVFGGISKVLQDVFTGGRIVLEAFGIDAVSIFEGLAAAITANIKSIIDGFKLLGKIAAPTAASIVSALEGTDKAKENAGLKAFEKQRDAIRNSRKETIQNANNAFKGIGDSFATGFTKAFAGAGQQDDFLNRTVKQLETNRNSLAKDLMGQFGAMRAERDKRQAEAQTAQSQGDSAGDTPIDEWLKRNLPKPREIGSIFKGLGARVGGGVAAAAQGGRAAAGFIAEGEAKRRTGSFIDPAELHKSIQLSLLEDKDDKQRKALDKLGNKVAGAVKDGAKQTVEAVKKIAMTFQ